MRQPRALRNDPPRDQRVGEHEQKGEERAPRHDEGTAEAEVGARRGHEGIPGVGTHHLLSFVSLGSWGNELIGRPEACAPKLWCAAPFFVPDRPRVADILGYLGRTSVFSNVPHTHFLLKTRPQARQL